MPLPPVHATRRTVLKWAGGKHALTSRILTLMPERFRQYYEPFLGGGAVYFALASERRFERARLADMNRELVNFYGVLKSDVGALLERLRDYATRLDERDYYAVRDADATKLDDVERAARFLYLNKTCFNGLWRENSEGRFNVPFGRYVRPQICDEPRLREASAALARAKLTRSDFETTCRDAAAGDVVYLDPPYVPVGRQGFTRYQGQDFSDADQERVVALFRDLAGRGVLAIASNADARRTRELYAGFELHEVQMARSINSAGDGRG
jgi:DNA adenine methylase